MNLKWIKKGWNDMWWENGPIVGCILVALFFLLAIIKPMFIATLIMVGFGLGCVTGFYMLFINPFVKAFKNRNM